MNCLYDTTKFGFTIQRNIKNEFLYININLINRNLPPCIKPALRPNTTVIDSYIERKQGSALKPGQYPYPNVLLSRRMKPLLLPDLCRRAYETARAPGENGCLMRVSIFAIAPLCNKMVYGLPEMGG